MKILVTGSSGTIGTRLCEKLLEQGHSVIGLDWAHNKWQPNVEKITTIIDLRDEQLLKALPSVALAKEGQSSSLRQGSGRQAKLKADLIVHLAANARVYELVEHPDRARDNILTTFNVLELARSKGIERFVFASSRESYGNIGAEKYTEDLVRLENCESPYTASKIAGEALVESYRRCYGIDFVTLRFSNVYGMYDDSVRVVPLFICLARKNKPLTVFGAEKCLDFTYIDDAVAGILLAIGKFDAAKNDVYNLAYGEGTTILHLAEEVKRLLKSSSEIRVGKSRTGEVIQYVADISKAKKKLGFKPKTPFSEGIAKTVEWYRTKL